MTALALSSGHIVQAQSLEGAGRLSSYHGEAIAPDGKKPAYSHTKARRSSPSADLQGRLNTRSDLSMTSRQGPSCPLSDTQASDLRRTRSRESRCRRFSLPACTDEPTLGASHPPHRTGPASHGPFRTGRERTPAGCVADRVSAPGDGVLTLSELHGYVDLASPEPRAGELERNEPGSDFPFISGPDAD